MVERAEDIFSFSHLTLQEYLTAQYIDDHRQIEELVTKHLTDGRWKEVFLLVAGLMRGGADELLLLMEKEAQKYINTPKLKALLKWAEQATAGSASDIKPVGKRAIAVANAIVNANANGIVKAYVNANAIAKAYANADANAYAFVKAINNAIANAFAYADAQASIRAIGNAINNAGELEQLKVFKDVNFAVLIARLEVLKAKISDDKQPLEVRQKSAQLLLPTLLKAFNLTLEMVDLSEEEIKAFDNYFYANYLILHCKQAAVRVSPKTWEEIEERMLLAPNN